MKQENNTPRSFCSTSGGYDDNDAKVNKLPSEKLKELYAGREPYGEWLDRNLVQLRDLKIPNCKVPTYTSDELTRLEKDAPQGWIILDFPSQALCDKIMQSNLAVYPQRGMT